MRLWAEEDPTETWAWLVPSPAIALAPNLDTPNAWVAVVDAASVIEPAPSATP